MHEPACQQLNYTYLQLYRHGMYKMCDLASDKVWLCHCPCDPEKVAQMTWVIQMTQPGCNTSLYIVATQPSFRAAIHSYLVYHAYLVFIITHTVTMLPQSALPTYILQSAMLTYSCIVCLIYIHVYPVCYALVVLQALDQYSLIEHTAWSLLYYKVQPYEV